VDPFTEKSESAAGRRGFVDGFGTVYEVGMDFAAAIELALWILGPAGIVALIFRLGRSRDSGRPSMPSADVEQIGPAWTETISTDGSRLYGRASSVNHILIDQDAMARMSESYIPAVG